MRSYTTNGSCLTLGAEIKRVEIQKLTSSDLKVAVVRKPYTDLYVEGVSKF